jgi:hypothetical protein
VASSSWFTPFVPLRAPGYFWRTGGHLCGLPGCLYGTSLPLWGRFIAVSQGSLSYEGDTHKSFPHFMV